MMTYGKTGEYVAAEPFRPFRIKMASGQSFDIRHPEMIMVGRSSARIYKNSESDPNGPSFWQEISLMLTESLEPIELRTRAEITGSILHLVAEPDSSISGGADQRSAASFA